MINYVNTENQFNKLLRKGLKYSEDVSVLFISCYDDTCQKILREIGEGNHSMSRNLNVVDSFKTPHAFVACSTTQVPCLVNIKKGRKEIDYYLPIIFDKLGISD